jgi:hypothetical protein
VGIRVIKTEAKDPKVSPKRVSKNARNGDDNESYTVPGISAV